MAAKYGEAADKMTRCADTLTKRKVIKKNVSKKEAKINFYLCLFIPATSVTSHKISFSHNVCTLLSNIL